MQCKFDLLFDSWKSCKSRKINILAWYSRLPFKVDATSLKLEIRLQAHEFGTNTRSGTEVIFTLIWLAHAFGSKLLCTYFKLKWRLGDFNGIPLISPPTGGLYHDCAVHDIDLITWILGEMPQSVFAQGHAFNDDIRAMNDVDQASIVLKFPSGVLATIDLNREAVYGYDQRLEVSTLFSMS